VWTSDVIRFGDTDAYSHVNNAVFATFCESGRVHLFRTRLDPTLPPGVYWVIVRLVINFHAELRYPGHVRIGTWLTKLGRSSLTLEYALFSSEQLAATAESVCVLMDGATRRPLPFPEANRAMMESLLRAPSDPGG
jgi:acyl-CoA thioester hydrolase